MIERFPSQWSVFDTKINTSWSILLSENNYLKLTTDLILYSDSLNMSHIGDTFDDMPIVQGTIDNFFTFTNNYWFVDRQGLGVKLMKSTTIHCT